QGLEGVRNPLGLLLVELRQRRDRDAGMGLQKPTALGFLASRKASGFFEGMFPGHHHQKEEITDADLLEPYRQREMTCDPSMQGRTRHRTPPRNHCDVCGGKHHTCKRGRCHPSLQKMRGVVYNG